MQRVAILDLRQTTDHKRTRIFRAKKLNLADPLQKLPTLFIRWLLLLVIWGHVVRLHDGKRLFPAVTGRSFGGFFEGGSEVDSALLPVLPVTPRAVGVDEWGDHVGEGLLGVCLQRREIPVVRRTRRAMQGREECKCKQGSRHHSTPKCSGTLHSTFGWGQ
jgi:hypothetical protein